jgi:hypothetical protein
MEKVNNACIGTEFSSVSVRIRLPARELTNLISIRQGDGVKIFPFSAAEPSPGPYPIDTGCSYLRLKRPRL